MGMHSDLVEFFDSRAGHYERILSLPFFKALERDEVGKVLQLVDVDGKSVLDIGCGPAKFCRLWSSKGAKFVAGMDFSMEMLQRARSKSEFDFLIGDAFHIPVKTDSFDVASCIGVANYYEDVKPLVEEILRVSREVILSFPQQSMLGRVYRRISGVKIFLRSREEVEDICSTFFQDYFVRECASNLTLLALGKMK